MSKVINSIKSISNWWQSTGIVVGKRFLGILIVLLVIGLVGIAALRSFAM